MNKEFYIANQFKVASLSYGIVCCLFGIVLNTIEPFKACTKKCENPIKILIEIFYIYMYVTSMIWIFAMCLFIFKAKRKQKVSIKLPNGTNKLIFFSMSNIDISKNLHHSEFVKKLRKNFKMKDLNENEEEKKEDEIELHPFEKASVNNMQVIESKIETKVLDPGDNFSEFHYTYDYENGTGELYMRCGVAIFSICTMIDRALRIIQMCEISINDRQVISECQFTFIVTMISRIASLLFIFVQTFFIFKYANIIINYGKNVSLFGIMHIIVTNLCATIRTIVYETMTEIRHHYLSTNHKKRDLSGGKMDYITDNIIEPSFLQKNAPLNQIYSVDSNLTNHIFLKPKIGCISLDRIHIDVVLYIQNAQDNLDSYLFPCIIEYSLMSLTVFCILWQSINKQMYKEAKYRATKHLQVNNNEIPNEQAIVNVGDESETHDTNKFTVDCGKSTTGLFFGILVILITIILLITYFIYKEHNQIMAIQLSEINEFCLLFLSLIVNLSIFVKLKFHRFDTKFDSTLDCNAILVIVGLAGIYLYGFYSIIAIIFSGIFNFMENLYLIINMLSIFEASLQSVLIINSLKMYTKDKSIKKKKPARSLIILLILIDVSLWLVETLSVKKYEMNELQLEYYDIIFWSIVMSISSPLSIFFRFHASVCLSDIWKTLYE